ncbi:hypothetical protein [Verrucomicrobium sp. BvORR034]|uniref:hypothetical protein n=1 Tax=Verrucomicrobium sp. BvORR034 TaxID=1396418 RepID=UPI000A921B50|nr:hypothetical protein [Verrucomicrobium sp. BvORR034]
MAVRQYGSQSYKFGFNDPAALAIASSIGIQPQSLTIDAEPEFEAEGKNLYAETEAYARGSAKRTFTMEGYIMDAILFENVLDGNASATFVFRGKVYIVKGGKQTVKNNEFQMGETTGVSFPKITDQTGTALN